MKTAPDLMEHVVKSFEGGRPTNEQLFGHPSFSDEAITAALNEALNLGLIYFPEIYEMFPTKH